MNVADCDRQMPCVNARRQKTTAIIDCTAVAASMLESIRDAVYPSSKPDAEKKIESD
jgi:hypothetical protein